MGWRLASEYAGWQLEHIFSSTEHFRGNSKSAIQHTTNVINLNPALQTGGGPSYNARMWLGYLRLWQAKHPSPKRPMSLLKFGYNLFFGLYLIRDAAKRADVSTKTEMEAQDLFFRGDIFHTWANMLMLLRSFSRPIYVNLLRIALRYYDKMANLSDSMRVGYYWLRRFEAQLLASPRTIDWHDATQHLNELKTTNELTQEITQIANAYVYFALILYLFDTKSEDYQHYFTEAERLLKGRGKDNETAFRRLMLIKRFTGDISLKQALTYFF